MRQRNDTGAPLVAHTDPPQVVEPDQVIDHDTYVVGLTVLDEPAAEEAASKKTAKTAAKEATS